MKALCVQAEQAVLGAVLAGARTFKEIAADVGLNNFEDERHREIFKAMIALDQKGQTIEQHALNDELRKAGVLPTLGGVDYVVSLVFASEDPAEVDEHIRAVRETNGGLRQGIGRKAIGKGQQDWPTLAPEALTGLAGDIVKAIKPHTEADPVAVLIHLLIGMGNMIGPKPHFRVEFDRHPARLNAVIVGETSKGRKGQSWSTPRRMLTEVDPDWKTRITSGLSSGEGLIFSVRDAEKADSGEEDKRLFVVEEEFAQPLKTMRREGNILSVTIRDAWDHGDLHPLTKNNRISATGAHISIVGHITREELLRLLTETEQGNGFANRFLWVLARRSNVIARPKGIPPEVLIPLVARLREAFEFASTVEEIDLDPNAGEMWEAVYPDLSEGKPGLLGAVISRGEAQVMRLACVYALLGCSRLIDSDHLKAGLALWEYTEASARFIFGDRIGDPGADRILSALQTQGEMTETEIHELFKRNVKAAQIHTALGFLQDSGRVAPGMRETDGRPAIIWRITN